MNVVDLSALGEMLNLSRQQYMHVKWEMQRGKGQVRKQAPHRHIFQYEPCRRDCSWARPRSSSSWCRLRRSASTFLTYRKPAPPARTKPPMRTNFQHRLQIRIIHLDREHEPLFDPWLIVARSFYFRGRWKSHYTDCAPQKKFNELKLRNSSRARQQWEYGALNMKEGTKFFFFFAISNSHGSLIIMDPSERAVRCECVSAPACR